MRGDHHLLFDRAQWSRGYAGEIRNHPYMRTPLRWDIHVALHNSISIIPVPDRHTLQRVVGVFEPTPDTLANIDQLIGAIDMASNHNQVHPNDRLLAELTMSALSRQLPFIRQGMVGYARAS